MMIIKTIIGCARKHAPPSIFHKNLVKLCKKCSITLLCKDSGGPGFKKISKKLDWVI